MQPNMLLGDCVYVGGCLFMIGILVDGTRIV